MAIFSTALAQSAAAIDASLRPAKVTRGAAETIEVGIEAACLAMGSAFAHNLLVGRRNTV